MQVLLILIYTTCEWHCILGSQASRKVLEDWAAVDSDVDDVAESLSNRTSSSRSKKWIVTTHITSFFIAIWTFITVSYSRTVDIVYRLVGRRRGADMYATPRRKLGFGFMIYFLLSVFTVSIRLVLILQCSQKLFSLFYDFKYMSRIFVSVLINSVGSEYSNF